ncbi:substrate-binding periplasmic protein [Undibacterium sp. TJN19]|uniref:substrate-binding periplasmic protein n=1 Tax=Undibacterium sp. TJN19 TaxID=3413055 RepID=UPI003BF2E1A1
MQFITKKRAKKHGGKLLSVKVLSLVLLGSLLLPCPTEVLAATREVVVLIPDPINAKGEHAPIPADRQRMLDYIAREADVHFDVQRYPWKRIFMLAEGGEGMIFGLSKTAARQRIYHFSRPIYANYVWLVTRADARFAFKTLADLKGKSIGIVAGTSYGDRFDEQKDKLFRVETDTNSMVARFNKLINRRMDAMVIHDPGSDARSLEDRINRYVGRQLAAEDKPPVSFSVLPYPLLVDDIHFAIRADKDDGLMNRIDAAIAKGRKLGLVNLDMPKPSR